MTTKNSQASLHKSSVLRLRLHRMHIALPLRPALLYLFSFFFPLIVRSVPEIKSAVPIGFDTPIYLALARELADKPVIMPFFMRLLGLLYSLGVDLVIFMKVFPVIAYALTILLAASYAYRNLRWTVRKTILLVVVMSLSAAMLRMSWDLHRQSFATILLLLFMNFSPLNNVDIRKIVFSVVLLSLVGLLHELTLAAATFINFSAALASLRKKSPRRFVVSMVLAAVPTLANMTVPLLFHIANATDAVSMRFSKYVGVLCLSLSLIVVTFSEFGMLGFAEPVQSLPSSLFAGFSPSAWYGLQLSRNVWSLSCGLLRS